MTTIRVCDYDQEEGEGEYWHCNEQAVGQTPCCKFDYCANHAWIAEEHETAGVLLIGCNGPDS